jgi:hypothetical protein
MKNFFQFLTEASQSQASMQAKKLGLSGDGHGGWIDRGGNIVARTEKGKLKFIDKKAAASAPEASASKKTAEPVQQPQVAPAAADAPVDQQQTQEPSELPSPEEIAPLTVVFGRFNPPTIGHEKLLKSAKRISGSGDIKIYPSRTQDPKKNPLDPDLKVSYMKSMFPDFSDTIINDKKMRTIFDVLVAASEDGYASVNIVVGSDRQAEFENLAQKYNGDLYTFDQIRVISAGVRDADADGVEGMSASKMRKAVAENDFEGFSKGIPKTMDDSEVQALFNSVRQGMKIKAVKKESYNLWEIAPKCDQKGLRENYLVGNIFNIGEEVQNLNTGLAGTIIRKGTNYLICVTEDDRMFKSWIRDVMEQKDIEVPKTNLRKLVSSALKRTDDNIDGFVDGHDKKTGPYGAFIPQARNIPKIFKLKESKEISGVPADQRLVGTDSYREYTMKMSDTKSIKNFINKYKVKK